MCDAEIKYQRWLLHKASLEDDEMQREVNRLMGSKTFDFGAAM